MPQVPFPSMGMLLRLFTFASRPVSGVTGSVLQPDLCTNQIETGNAGADKVKACDVVGCDILGSCRKCECAFHDANAFGVFSSELHDKGQLTAHPGLGQQTPLSRPADFSRFKGFI